MVRGDKFERTLSKYGLESLADEVVEKWTRDDESNRSSTRDLSQLVNERICAEAIRSADGSPPVNSLDDIVAILRVAQKQADSDAPVETAFDPWTIEELKAWINQETEYGWDEIADDFVSHSLVYVYLTNIRGAAQGEGEESDKTPEEYRKSVIDRLEKAGRRHESAAEQALKDLADRSLIPDNEVSIDVSVGITCPVCRADVQLYQYINSHGCPYCDNTIADDQ